MKKLFKIDRTNRDLVYVDADGEYGKYYHYIAEFTSDAEAARFVKLANVLLDDCNGTPFDE